MWSNFSQSYKMYYILFSGSAISHCSYGRISFLLHPLSSQGMGKEWERRLAAIVWAIWPGPLVRANWPWAGHHLTKLGIIKRFLFEHLDSQTPVCICWTKDKKIHKLETTPWGRQVVLLLSAHKGEVKQTHREVRKGRQLILRDSSAVPRSSHSEGPPSLGSQTTPESLVTTPPFLLLMAWRVLTQPARNWQSTEMEQQLPTFKSPSRGYQSPAHRLLLEASSCCHGNRFWPLTPAHQGVEKGCRVLAS